MLEQHTQAPEISGDPFKPDERLVELEHRLERGWRMIEMKEASGEATDHLFDHFLRLLRDYESLCDLSRAA